jgi:hypothetical protein
MRGFRKKGFNRKEEQELLTAERAEATENLGIDFLIAKIRQPRRTPIDFAQGRLRYTKKQGSRRPRRSLRFKHLILAKVSICQS